MTLQELINELPEDKRFMVGAHSGYFFGGKRNDFEIEIDGAYEKANKDQKSSLREAERNRTKYRAVVEKYSQKSLFCCTAGIECDYDELIENEYREKVNLKLQRLQLFTKEYYKSLGKLITYNGQVDMYTKNLELPEYRNRKVIRQYPSIQDNSVLIIIIEGIESGKYWDIDEAEECRKQREAKKG